MLLLSLLGCLGISSLMNGQLVDLQGIQVNGFYNIIIALEFAINQLQLEQILNAGRNNEATIEAIANHTRFDFAFITAYGLFLGTLIIYLLGTKDLLPKFLITLLAIACISDVIENLAILDLVGQASYLDLPEKEGFRILSKATYMKWTLLFVVVGSSLYWKLQQWFLRRKSGSWIALALLIFLLLVCVAFVLTSVHHWFPAELRPEFIEKIIVLNGLVLLSLFIWPLGDLFRGVRMLFK